MTLRDYIGADNFAISTDSSPQKLQGIAAPVPKPSPDGLTIFYQILDRVRKQGAKSETATSRAKTSGSIKVSHQSLLRMYDKRDPVASAATHACAVDALDRALEAFKQLLKKQMLVQLRGVKLGSEYEEMCYNI